MKLRRDKFLEEHFITCDECGYNNEKHRFQNFGTCLRCSKIIDDKVYFKAQLRKQTFKKPNVRGKNKTRAILYF